MMTERPFACEPILPLIKPDYVGVEIGVFKGNSSGLLLKACKFMYFVDPFTKYEEYSDNEILDKDVLQLFLLSLEGKADRYKFINKFSKDAINEIPEVDFVFIDANHAYKYVLDDINTYWPKVRPGGFISGHDYNFSHADVMKAANEFAVTNHLQLHARCDCWVIPKL